MLSSSALACSSKLNLRHMRLRSARPQARLMREPYGEWMTRWVSPTSSKKRSKTMRRWLGSTPSAAFDAARYSVNCCAADAGRRSASSSQRSQAPALSSRCVSAASHRRDTAWLNSSLRPGLSPSQNGMLGGWPLAS